MSKVQNSDESNRALTVERQETIQEVRTKFARAYQEGVVDFWRRMDNPHPHTSGGLFWSMVPPEQNVEQHLNPDGLKLELEWVKPPGAPETYTIALRRQGPKEGPLMLGEKLIIYELLGMY